MIQAARASGAGAGGASGETPAGVRRDLSRAEADRFDVAIIGGGILGAATALEASRRGLRCALVERDDFGGHASLNSMRILHGGLRYLQTMDLVRYYESVGERKWFLRELPDLCGDMTCLLPLYGMQLRHPLTLGPTLALNELLSAHRNAGVERRAHLAGGRLVSKAELARRWPGAPMGFAKGAAEWHDGLMKSPQRVQMELLRRACALGSVALNYVEAAEVVAEGGRVAGLACVDAETGRGLTIRCDAVLNLAGRWTAGLADGFGRADPMLAKPALAFNLLVDRPAPADSALAATAPRADAQTFFMYPIPGGLMIGTRHLPWEGGQANLPGGPLRVPEALVHGFIEDINEAAPGLGLEPRHVRRVLGGILMGKRDGHGQQAKRPHVVDHAEHGGPAGLVSVRGIKYTTARTVGLRGLAAALKTLGRALPARAPAGGPVPASRTQAGWNGSGFDPTQTGGLLGGDAATAEAVGRIAAEESCVRPGDLMIRRVDWAMDPAGVPAACEKVGEILGWDAGRIGAERDAALAWNAWGDAGAGGAPAEPRAEAVAG